MRSSPSASSTAAWPRSERDGREHEHECGGLRRRARTPRRRRPRSRGGDQPAAHRPQPPGERPRDAVALRAGERPQRAREQRRPADPRRGGDAGRHRQRDREAAIVGRASARGTSSTSPASVSASSSFAPALPASARSGRPGGDPSTFSRPAGDMRASIRGRGAAGRAANPAPPVAGAEACVPAAGPQRPPRRHR